MTLAGLIVGVAGLTGSLSFFGEGADEAFRRWTNLALLAGGAVAVAAGAAGTVVGRRARQSVVRRLGAAAAMLVGVVAVVIGVAVWHARSEPQGQERAALQRLAVPPGASGDTLTIGSLPSGSGVIAGPPGLGPPVAVRSWRPGGCGAVNRALLAWADAGSVQVPRGFAPGAGTPRCLWFATYHGWPARAEVLGSAPGQQVARVIIAPPGVGL